MMSIKKIEPTEVKVATNLYLLAGRLGHENSFWSVESATPWQSVSYTLSHYAVIDRRICRPNNILTLDANTKYWLKENTRGKRHKEIGSLKNFYWYFYILFRTIQITQSIPKINWRNFPSIQMTVHFYQPNLVISSKFHEKYLEGINCLLSFEMSKCKI